MSEGGAMDAGMSRRDFLRGAAVAGLAAAFEIGDFMFDTSEAEAADGVDKEAREQALALLKKAFEEDKGLQKKYIELGRGPIGGNASDVMPQRALEAVLKDFPAIQRLQPTEIRISIVKPASDQLLMVMAIKGKDGRNHTITVPGKLVKR